MTVADEELISCYYRPITKFAAIQDKNKARTLAIFNDRPQAGVSRRPGCLEFIYERKTLSSDWKGVGEVTNDDYDGFFGYVLWFLPNSDQDEVRKIQVENELEVLHMVTASNQTNLSPNTSIAEPPLPKSFNDSCISIDVIPVEKLAVDFSLQLTLTNVCSKNSLNTTLVDVLGGLGMKASNLKKIRFRTADGMLRIKDGKDYKAALS